MSHRYQDSLTDNGRQSLTRGPPADRLDHGHSQEEQSLNKLDAILKVIASMQTKIEELRTELGVLREDQLKLASRVMDTECTLYDVMP
ncbi:hypothetical protein NDU88_010493 [Pleurodeles waltl]|uniref:Uncharacterized protein n=1 Tax=Pleurodeles waltl TaxID=8319 RepID=A0AAV7QY65_PLEWA|nr:hypothetical protein NDU88_010493 [Pleurodeles waltl]